MVLQRPESLKHRRHGTARIACAERWMRIIFDGQFEQLADVPPECIGCDHDRSFKAANPGPCRVKISIDIPDEERRCALQSSLLRLYD